ncbi:permease-like cell division protein FtsX [Bacillus massiliglaciei]|uniref:permease-like cell division protein FtsX n=1 Tax=Bacillus massiliglaciei TaxID=1816693 RepID=UPI000B0F23EE|nr:permease-like cell division protein FtsX [Bacillus massiliglaciei]
MKFRTLLRHFRESFKNIRRNGWMTFASVSAVTVTLILVGVFAVIMLNLNHMAKNVEDDVEIRVHIDNAANDADRKAIEDKLNSLAGVQNVTFSPKEKELSNLISDLGENGDVFKPFEQDNPLRDVFVVTTKTPDDVISVAKKAEKYNYVQSVKYGQGYVENLFSFVDIARNIGIVLIIGLLFTAIFLISNTIKITIMARRKEIEIMRLVGATNTFIRWPFFLEGLWLGILGSIIPIALIAAGYKKLYEYATPQITIEFIELLPSSPFIYQIALILIAIGALIGIWGSVMSVRKFLKV